MGYIFLASEDYDEALMWWAKVLEINPKEANTLFNAGYAYMQLGEYHTAREFFTRYLDTSAVPFWQKQARWHLDEIRYQLQC